MFLFVQGDFGKDEESKVRRRLSKRRSSSSLLAKSAPPTPQGERLLQPPGAAPAPGAAPGPGARQPAPPPPRSPARSFGRHDGQALKQLSASTPAMTQAQAAARAPAPSAEPLGAAAPASASSASASASSASAPAAAAASAPGAGGGGGGDAQVASPGAQAAPAPSPAPAAPEGEQAEAPGGGGAAGGGAGGGAGVVVGVAAGPGSSKSRQKKFHSHFKSVAAEEHVLNYYSCALVGDILLQGHLYITKNYFAFYSNVFGYVTKLLIPTVSVLEVTKEKTARIIPNAIGVATGLEKHVFGSLLSRDSTYKLMMRVWQEARAQGPKITLPPVQVIKTEVDSVSGDIALPEDEDSSMSDEHSCPPTPVDCPTDISQSEGDPGPTAALLSSAGAKLPNGGAAGKLAGKLASKLAARKSVVAAMASPAPAAPASWAPRPAHLLLVSTALLVLLFLSAAFLLYRIGRVQTQFAASELSLTAPGSDDIYQEILKWQTQLHSRSANEVQEFLNANLHQLAKVRQSLEALSLLIVTEEQHLQRQQKLQKEAETTSQQHQHYKHQHHHHHSQEQEASALPHDRLS